MELILYKVSDDERKINKTLENGLTLNVNVRRDVDIHNPFFLMKKTDTFNPVDYNYIQWNGKYYFIRDITYTAKSMYRIDTHIDVLMSYKNLILTSTAKIKQSINVNPYFNGGDYHTLVTEKVDLFYSDTKLPLGETNILMTIGS